MGGECRLWLTDNMKRGDKKKYGKKYEKTKYYEARQRKAGITHLPGGFVVDHYAAEVTYDAMG